MCIRDRNEAGEHALAAVRADQARAIADAYGLDLPTTAEEMESLLADDADVEVEEAEPILSLIHI